MHKRFADETGVLPESVRMATVRAGQAGFAMSCDPGTGRLLSVLAAAVPVQGRVLELGTGTGVGTAWITHGLRGRDDVEVVTVEIDTATAALAAQHPWPSWVKVINGDAVEVTLRSGSFDLIFADAQGGKWDGLDTTVAALRPGAHLLVVAAVGGAVPVTR
jgi:predicted O-methyltransferase YrrM